MSPPRPSDPHAENRKELRAIGRARLKAKEAPAAIRRAAAAGMRPTDISREVKMTYEGVHKILKNQPATDQTGKD